MSAVSTQTRTPIVSKSSKKPSGCHSGGTGGMIAMSSDPGSMALGSSYSAYHLRPKKNRSKGIPFAFSPPAQDWFSDHGNLHVGPDRLGLTCGNFVLALYHAVGLPLVSFEKWPSREDDVVWQQSFIDELAPRIELAKRETQEHFAQVRREIGTVRCRPTEIGGAALASEFPCDFDTAVKLAVEIERNLPSRPATPPVQA